MRKFASTLAAFPPALTVLLCLAAAPAPAQSFTFTSNGTGTYFTDNLTMGQPHAVDFFSRTSGQSAGRDSILTIGGYGNSDVIYTHEGSFYHENTELTTASIKLQDAASGAMLFSAFGPLHYEFITSPFGINTLTLGGIVLNDTGMRQNFNFFKDEDAGKVSANTTPSPVPELAPSASLGMMLGLTLAGVVWSGRKWHKPLQND